MIVVMFEVKPISEKTDRKFDPVNAHYDVDSRDGQRWAFKVTFYLGSAINVPSFRLVTSRISVPNFPVE